ncbi:MAG TPA: sialidase family protein [Opitutaceae bacterium]
MFVRLKLLYPLVAAALLGGLAPLPAAQSYSYQKIFDGGSAGDAHSYRIPSLVRTTNGTLIAFAEKRKFNNSDWGDINLVCKRSTNDGATWGAEIEVEGVGPGSWTNPTAVCNTKAGTSNYGRVWVFFNWHSDAHSDMSTIGPGDRKTYSAYSDDHGATWSTPVDRTATLKPASMAWDAVGPGIGIQTTQANSGRLIIPATNRNIYSNDYGATWTYSSVPGGTGESAIVECLGGDLYRNDRPVSSQWDLSKRRRISYASNITSWTAPFTSDPDLLDPKCEASILRYNFDAPDRIIFLNPASTVTRSKMRVRISYDDGATWPISRPLWPALTEQQCIDQGKGGYSSMIKTADYHVGALVEINENPGSSSTSHRSIEFHKFNLEWIRDGAPDP